MMSCSTRFLKFSLFQVLAPVEEQFGLYEASGQSLCLFVSSPCVCAGEKIHSTNYDHSGDLTLFLSGSYPVVLGDR